MGNHCGNYCSQNPSQQSRESQMGDYPDQMIPTGGRMLPPSPMGMGGDPSIKYIEECENRGGAGGYHLLGGQYAPHMMMGIIYETNKDLQAENVEGSYNEEIEEYPVSPSS